MKLSLIIPIYNVEKYIEKCLLSCLRQDISYNDYEIIVVNDGSPDTSLSIAERVAKDYSNITIISQDNQGLSGARNTGLKHAKGEYIWFVDSDDYIEENCLGGIVSYLKDDLDILQLQYRLVYEDETPSLDARFCQIEGIKSGTEVTEQGGLPAPAPFSVLRSNFLKENNLEFVRGIYHEDTEFKPRATYLAKKILSINNICYNYLQRNNGSITSRFRKKNAEDLIIVVNKLHDFAKRIPLKTRFYFNKSIATDINSLLYGIRCLSYQERENIIDLMRTQRHIYKSMLLSADIKYIMEGIMLFLNVNWAIKLYSYFKRT